MKMSMASLVFAVIASTVSAEKQMQINYYSDSLCKSYLGQVDVSWATKLIGGPDNCYNYNYGNGVAMAECNKRSCLCNIFFKENCQGSGAQQIYNGGTCIGGASQLKSFACYYT